MADLKTILSLIDLNQIEKTKIHFSDLFEIVKSEKMNDDNVFKKISELNSQIAAMNNLPQEFNKDYKSEFEKWINELNAKQEKLNDFTSELDKVYNHNINNSNIDDYVKIIEKFNEKYPDKNIEELLNYSFDINFEKVILLESQRLFIKFSRQRKFIHFFINYVYKFRYFLLKFLSVIFSFLITSLASFILKFAFEEYSDFFISFIILIISFFTLDKWISKKSSKIFWRIARSQTLMLYGQFQTYTAHILAITNFLKIINKKTTANSTYPKGGLSSSHES